MRARLDVRGSERAEDLALAFAQAFASRRIYGPEHQRTDNAARRFHRSLRDFASHTREGRPFRLRNDVAVLSCEGLPLRMTGPLAQLAHALERQGCSAVVLRPHATPEALDGLVAWLCARDPGSPPALQGVEILHEHPDDEARDALEARFPEFRIPLRLYRTTGETLDRTMRHARAGRDLNLRDLLDLSHEIAEEAERSGSHLLGPLQLVQQDLFTFQHSVNVALIAATLVQPFEPDRHRVAEIAQAALLHDIGKSRIPHAILHKKDKLTADEIRLLRQHPALGADLLLDYREVAPLVIEAAYCHHMRDDGLGYPQTRSTLRPGPITDLIQVSDMFEALTAYRPYKRSYSVLEAIELIRATPGMASKQSVLSLLAHRLTSSPPGARVELDGGEHAIVIAAHPEHPEQPTVRVVADAAGNEVERPYVLDLRKTEGNAPRRAVRRVLLKPRRPTAVAVTTRPA